MIRDGGVIAYGYNQELDDLRNLSQNANQFLLDMENREKENTGIATLRIKYNRVHGYYIEIPRSQSDDVPGTYIRKQTLKNAERFFTNELKEFEDTVLSAKENSLAFEKKLYEELLNIIACSKMKVLDKNDIALLFDEQVLSFETSQRKIFQADILLGNRHHTFRQEISNQI